MDECDSVEDKEREREREREKGGVKSGNDQIVGFE